MQHEKNIAGLKQQLQALGFGDGMENCLRSNICFQQEYFNLSYRLVKDGDVINFRIHLEQRDKGHYNCNYYDAVLRKDIIIAAGDTTIAAIESKMAAIKWDYINENVERVEAVSNDLQALSATEEGKKTADLLRYKYWADTPVENLIQGIGSFNSQFEISQRFYISEGQGITTEEAYRFLCNKWMEKKVQAKRKKTQ